MTGPSPLQPGDLVAGKYRVERVLGAGGMGLVFAASHVELGQPVAVKVIRPEALDHPEVVERFVREARAAGRLRSEHVARVFDVGTLQVGGGPGAFEPARAVPYLVMEYLEGTDLDARLAAGPIPIAEAVQCVIDACDALAEAHAIGIVHRDIKPANLFLTRRPNGAPLVKLLDFGISKVASDGDAASRLTAMSTIMGTPLYMAPEQMRSAREASPASDLWSLGAVLYELLTGKVPFPGDSFTEICARVLTNSPPPPRALRPDIPRGLEAAVLRCLEKDPARRFAGADDLAHALAAFAPPRAASRTRPAPPPAPARTPQGTAVTHPTANAWDARPDLPGRSSVARALVWGVFALVITSAVVVSLVLLRPPAAAPEVSALAGATAEGPTVDVGAPVDSPASLPMPLSGQDGQTEPRAAAAPAADAPPAAVTPRPPAEAKVPDATATPGPAKTATQAPTSPGKTATSAPDDRERTRK